MVVGIVYEKNEKTAYPDIVAGSSGIDIRIVFLIQFFKWITYPAQIPKQL